MSVTRRDLSRGICLRTHSFVFLSFLASACGQSEDSASETGEETLGTETSEGLPPSAEPSNDSMSEPTEGQDSQSDGDTHGESQPTEDGMVDGDTEEEKMDSDAGQDGEGESEGGENEDSEDGLDEDSGEDEGANDSSAMDSGLDTGMMDEEGGDDDGTEEPLPPDVPDTDYCRSVMDWDGPWRDFEAEVIELTNQRRAAGANCRSGGNFGPAGPVAANPILRCAARVHALDMHQRNFFSHYGSDGSSPFQRMERAGYNMADAGENVARGQRTPAEVVQGWMNSDGHCATLMKANFTELGVGYHPNNGTKPLWVQNFGQPG